MANKKATKKEDIAVTDTSVSKKTTTRRAGANTNASLKKEVVNLQAEVKALNDEVAYVGDKIVEINAVASDKETKLQLISSIILERLDGDGDRDLEGLSGKINWLFILRNLGTIASMIREIIAVVKV